MRRILVTAIALALAGAALDAAAQTRPPGRPTNAARRCTDATTQLPRTVRPTHYDVAVVPHADKLTFDGKVAISRRGAGADRPITLNAVDLTFANVGAQPAATASACAAEGHASTRPRRPRPSPSTKPLARRAIPAGHRLHRQDRHPGQSACSPSTTTPPAGKKRALFTQFENSDARRFIPSWDEPAYKATFALEADVPASADGGQQHAGGAAHRGPGQRPNARALRDRRRRCRPTCCSSAVGDLERATDAGRARPKIGVVTQKRRARPGAVRARLLGRRAARVQRLLRHALSAAQARQRRRARPQPVLRRHGELGRDLHLRVRAAARSVDLHGVGPAERLLDRRARDRAPVVRRPRDHGLVGRPLAQRRLRLLDGRRAPRRSCIRSGTPRSARGRPAANAAMGATRVATTHPVVQHVETVEQASQAFDAITYQKGEAVIRMLEGYVGADAWRDGVRALHARRTPTATPSPTTCGATIEAAAGKPIIAIAHDFTLQPGVPLITRRRRRRAAAARPRCS